MQITTTAHGNALVLHLDGSLDTSTAAKAEAETNMHIKDHSKIVMDLSNVKFVSSAGLRVFLATAKRLKAAGGVLRLCNANEVVMEILTISGFTTILEVKSDVASALAGL